MTFNTETWIAMASAFVAMCALAVTIWQGHQNYEHNKLSVRPRLTTVEKHETIKTGIKVSRVLINSGIGPAIIKDFILIYDGKEVSKNNHKAYEDFLKREAKARDIDILYISLIPPGATISVKEQFKLFVFQYKHKQDISFIDKLDLRIHYQSIYEDEVFIYDSRKSRIYSGEEDEA